jgi:hypothetical protein
MAVCDPPDARMPIDELHAFFGGCWSIDRRIDDRCTGRRYGMRGRGTFAPDGDAGAGLVYDERVVWQPDGQPVVATRRYRVSRIVGARGRVRFADGRPFYDLDLSDGRCAVAHHCPPDVYDGAYRVLDADRFTVTWRVGGPRKNSVLTTLYTRRT